MPRYIDANDFKREMEKYLPEDRELALKVLKSIKTADVVERKKGKWLHGCCSECGYNWGNDAPIASVPNFCPNCGADIRDKNYVKK